MESLLDDLEHESHTEIRVSERVSQRSEKRHSEAREAARKKNLLRSLEKKVQMNENDGSRYRCDIL